MKKTIILLLVLNSFQNIVAQKKSINLLVGTYTNACESKGIYVYNFDSITGNCILKSSTSESINPSYISVSPNKKNVFAVNENGEKSTISSFDFNKNTGALTLNSIQNALGSDPCYIISDKKNIIAANYSGGDIAVFKHNLGGNLSVAKQVLQHFGGSTNLQRQKSPHVHMVQFSVDKKYVLAVDLGLDKIMVYDYKPLVQKNVLVLNSTVEVKKGSGPRHCAFSKNGTFLYVLQELSGDVSVYTFKNGTLTLQSETTVLEKNYSNEPRAADIHISPDNKFLYASNRETANDISIFKILPEGNLAFVARMPTLGNGPRNFVIDPSGNFLLVANQKTNNIVVFARNKTTGLLSDTGKRINVCSPVCLVFDNQ